MKKLLIVLFALALNIGVQAQLPPSSTAEEERARKEATAFLASIDSIYEALKYTVDDFVEDVQAIRSEQGVLDWSLEEMEALMVGIEDSDPENTNRCELTAKFAFRWYETVMVEIGCRQKVNYMTMNTNEEDCPGCQGLSDSIVAEHEDWYNNEYWPRRVALVRRATRALPQYADYLME